MKQKKNLKPLSFSEISLFCEQLSMTLRAGISAAEGIRILYDESKNAQEREILGCIIEHLENLESLHDSLAASKVFPKYMLNMIRIGEETGTLDEVTASLSEYYDHEDSVKKYIRESVTSPVIMSSMIIAVIIVIETLSKLLYALFFCHGGIITAAQRYIFCSVDFGEIKKIEKKYT